MPAHATFIKKCMALSNQVGEDLDCTTWHLEFSELFMERLLSTTRPETLLRQILNADDHDFATKEACYHALHVEDSGQAIASIAIATGNARRLFNQYMQMIDSHILAGLHAEDFGHEATVRALKRLRSAEKSHGAFHLSPQYQFFASYALEIALDDSLSLDGLLSTMSVTQIHACAPALKGLGITLFSDERLAGYGQYPYYYLQHCSIQELRPTFDLLVRLHGGVMAQKMMFEAQANAKTKAVFLTADEIALGFGKDQPVLAVKQCIACKDDIYADNLAWMMTALRQEGRLDELDVLSKSESKYLLDLDLLQLTDLSVLPRLTAFHSEQRLGADLGL
ncbi:hypothetical protein [Pseudomonas amygdali]|uniref:Uncharacterized protein n=2 Tax=Pseudomonas amygdali pv. lachrymans TaxID=53707 RepID=A0ABR5KSB3_PSEAV|nr:hypothetical protein [Pseudomonas amygdali]AXH60302.1 hypothetical protein PLA107_034540 [Pseudomonas amygdali pv. lachrymans str. M301315]KPC17692.1 Uncharacterized protein AC499_0894 [Pseudomonas amygdali pv. lachrymans]RMT06325.1 hypothetical protein ALP54_04119 [Pseudomonas amygdali pv. lachrymans]